MCLPALAIAGIAASALGAGMQYFGQQKAEDAQIRTFTQEQDRQHKFQNEQNKKFGDSLEGAEEMADPRQQAAAAAARSAALMASTKSASPAADGYLPGSSSANAIVANDAKQQGEASDARTSSLADALGSLGGFSDLLQRTQIRTGRNSQDIDQLAGFASGSRSVNQSEIEAAKQKGAGLRTLGGLASSIGGMMMSGGMGGGAGGAAIGPISTSGATANFMAANPIGGSLFAGMR